MGHVGHGGHVGRGEHGGQERKGEERRGEEGRGHTMYFWPKKKSSMRRILGTILVANQI